MRFLRVPGTVIICILLFVNMVLLSFAFVVNNTILSADFVNKQVDKLDISSIASETIDERIREELPPDTEFLTEVAIRAVDTEEPLIKEQVHAGISEGYSYILGEKDTLNITFSLVKIKQSLKENLWDTAVEYLKTRLSGMSDAEVDRYVAEIRRQIPRESLPAVLALLPETQRNAAIDEYLKELGGRGSVQSLSFFVDLLLTDQIRAYVQNYFDDYINNIPDSFTISESDIGADTMDALRQVKQYVHYSKVVYFWLIIFVIIFAGLIFLINRNNVRASMLAIGIDALVFGVLSLAGVLVLRSKQTADWITGTADVSLSVQTWIESLFRDITGVMLWFSIGEVIIGVGLLTASFFIRKPVAIEIREKAGAA